MKYKIFFAISILFMISIYCYSTSENLNINNEIVMSEGMQIVFTNSNGTMTVTAGKGYRRYYTWEGATRYRDLWPRKQRWNGSLGLYGPGTSGEWKEHTGITRGILEEGEMHFKNVDEFNKWANSYEDNLKINILNDTGLFVGWLKRAAYKPPGALYVHVWQIFIDGKKPTKLPGSQNDKIKINYNVDVKPYEEVSKGTFNSSIGDMFKKIRSELSN